MSLSNFGRAVADKVRGLACQTLSNPLIDGRQWGSEPPYRGVGVGDNPLTRRWYNSTIDRFKSLVCNDPTPTDEDDLFPPLPFSGGQCCDTRYRADLAGLNQLNQPDTRQVSLPRGKVRGVITDFSALGFPAAFVETEDCSGAVARTLVIAVNTFEQAATWAITGIQVVEGLDNCGDGRARYNPVNVVTYNDVDITYVDNSNETTNVLGDFNLFAPVFLPGSVTIPFAVNLGGLTLNGTLDLNGEVSFTPTIDITINRDGEPVEGPEFDPTDQPNPDTDPPTEEQIRTLVGAWVRQTSPGRRASEVLEGGLISYYPRWGILKFRVRSPAGITLSEGIDLKTADCFVPAPPNCSAIGVEFVPYYGSSCTVRLAFADLDPDDIVAPD